MRGEQPDPLPAHAQITNRRRPNRPGVAVRAHVRWKSQAVRTIWARTVEMPKKSLSTFSRCWDESGNSVQFTACLLGMIG